MHSCSTRIIRAKKNTKSQYEESLLKNGCLNVLKTHWNIWVVWSGICLFGSSNLLPKFYYIRLRTLQKSISTLLLNMWCLLKGSCDKRPSSWIFYVKINKALLQKHCTFTKMLFIKPYARISNWNKKDFLLAINNIGFKSINKNLVIY